MSGTSPGDSLDGAKILLPCQPYLPFVAKHSSGHDVDPLGACNSSRA